VRESGGAALAVEDDAIAAALDECGRGDGLLLCPEGAATLAGLRLAQERGLMRWGERVVLFNCADGHKYPLREASATLDRTQPIDFVKL
jgi:threonine synthase